MRYGSVVPVVAAGVCAGCVIWVWSAEQRRAGHAPIAAAGMNLGSTPAVPPVSGSKPPAGANADPDPRVAELDGVIGNKPVLDEADAARLTEFYTTDDVVIQRWALVITGDRLRHAKMPDHVRGQLEGIIADAMVNPVWRLRRTAIVAIQGSALSKRADFRERIEKLTHDPQTEVSVAAKRALNPES